MQRLTRFGILSFAKILGLVGLIAGFLLSIPSGLTVILAGASAGANAASEGTGIAAIGVGGGVLIMLGVPFLYAGLSFLAGLFYGLIINLVLRLAGGLVLCIETPGHPKAAK